jgi:Cu-Zn family superoxide dismutase
MLMAEANFDPPGSNNITGSVVFTQYNSDFVRVDIKLDNVPPGLHGIHIHENPIKFFKNQDYCKQAGGHFNGPLKLWSPQILGGTKHGSWRLDTERHVGDLCNNILSFTGPVSGSYIDQLISLIPDHPHCIIGRSIVIHEDSDDEGLFKMRNIEDSDRFIQSKITGNAGKRIACANIH